VSLADVDHLAVNQNSSANWLRKLRYVLTTPPTTALLRDRISNRARRASLPELLAKEFPGQRFAGKFHRIEHHLAHLSSAFHVSPFEEESWCQLMASVTLPVPPGASDRGPTSRSKDVCIFRTRSGSSIRHLRNILAFPTMAMSTR
jgi:hypothetical protein